MLTELLHDVNRFRLTTTAAPGMVHDIAPPVVPPLTSSLL